MKKLKLIFLLLILFSMTSCGILGVIDIGNSFLNIIESINTYDVTFVYNNGLADKIVQVNKGDKIERPSVDPEKNYFTFTGWYKESTCENEYIFDDSVTKDITLYAGYSLDLTKTTLTEDILKTNVVIEMVERKASVFGTEVSSRVITGSGVIFKETESKYYALTNNHVVYKDEGYDSFTYSVYDYKGYKYEATLEANKATYDLAIVSFNKTRELNVIEMAEDDAELNTSITAIGQPNGVTNTITTGSIKKYEKVTLDDSQNESNIKFDVIVHTAEIYSGSSGGALLDSNYKLVGINYAGAENQYGRCIESYAVPINKVKEFIALYLI